MERREVFSGIPGVGHHLLEVGPNSPFQTIQAAVDSAKPGDTVKIFAGTYAESVVVTTPDLTIEGAPNNKVVITSPNSDKQVNAQEVSAPNGIWVTADPTMAPSETTIPTSTLDGFRLVNVTVVGFSENGVLLTGVRHFVLSHVTTANNGEYGLFPIFSSDGTIAACAASGSNDTGIYVGQSHAIIVTGNSAFDNVNGIEVENSNNVQVKNNKVHDNTVGILEDLLPGLAIEASINNVIAGNRVWNNNRPNTASPEDIVGAEPSGVGIAIVGGSHTLVFANRVTHNAAYGIVVLSLVDLVNPLPLPYPPGVDPDANSTIVSGNIVRANGVDLAWSGKGSNNRWFGNTYVTSNVPLPR